MVLPWISHILCSFIPALIMCKLGADVVELIKTTLPMDGLAMKLYLQLDHYYHVSELQSY